MRREQSKTPLYTALTEFKAKNPMSLHVPGHKNGAITPYNAFRSILPYDLTELTGLDDLHAANGVIQEASELAADYFMADETFFLVGGSTVGNLVMILSTCKAGDVVLVQRNSHKSVLNGLELCGVTPVFLTPVYDQHLSRYTAPSIETLKVALDQYPEAKAVLLTYPDYFGRAYAIEPMIDLIHDYHMLALIDEAHGVHFSLGSPFPQSAMAYGADMAVQSAHKMAPALTMASYLHMRYDRVARERVHHYLQMLESSSPSYLLMASLDVTRCYLANFTPADRQSVMESVQQMRAYFTDNDNWVLLPLTQQDDPLKLTLEAIGMTGFALADAFERVGVYPELATDRHVLLIHGLEAFTDWSSLKKAIVNVKQKLKKTYKHATIETQITYTTQPYETLAISYQHMYELETIVFSWQQAIGRIAAEAVIPYPPGIPLVMKGERLTEKHIEQIDQLYSDGARFENDAIEKGLRVFYE